MNTILYCHIHLASQKETSTSQTNPKWHHNTAMVDSCNILWPGQVKVSVVDLCYAPSWQVPFQLIAKKILWKTELSCECKLWPQWRELSHYILTTAHFHIWPIFMGISFHYSGTNWDNAYKLVNILTGHAITLQPTSGTVAFRENDNLIKHTHTHHIT